jgi:hypothetical protein
MASFREPDIRKNKQFDIGQYYVMTDAKYVNQSPCIGGKMMTIPGKSWPAAHKDGGRIVDIESELRGMTFDNSKAPSKKYMPITNTISQVLFGEQSRSFRQGTQSLVFNTTNSNVNMCDILNVDKYYHK